MCGISGAIQIGFDNLDFNELENIINLLIDSIKVRGPNNIGKVKIKNGFLGHTRLSIRDLSESSNQPIILENSKSCFVYNGEIYNTYELLKNYSLKQTPSDTLCLKSLFENLKDFSFISELVGDFAIAFWDNELKKLFLVRDHLGKKPIYYATYKDYFLFNSSIKGIQNVIRSNFINKNSLTNYLVYGNMFDDKTIFHEIKQVLPGTILIWDAITGKIKFEEFFNFNKQIIQNSYLNLKYKDLTSLLSDNLENVISSHLCSDVPISLFLSSGIDSKAVAKYSLSAKIKAYTADFKNNEKEVLDSLDFSNYYNDLDHEIVKIKDFSVFNILERIIDFLGEPFADASIIPLFCLYSNLPKDRKVVLQGDGGDELFGGYNRYQTFNYLNKIPNNNLLISLSRFTKTNHRLQRIMNLSTLQNEDLYKNIMTTDFTGYNTISFFKNYLNHQKVDIYSVIGNEYERDYKNNKGLSTQERLSAVDLTNQLPNQFLYKVDRVSMMCGIEARVPLVDIRLLKLVFSIDPRIRFKSNPQKRFFRDSVNIPNKYKFTPKRGFGTPISKWMHQSKPYLRKNILSKSFIEYFMLNKNDLNKLINMNKYSSTESYCLWKILCLSIWFRKVLKIEY